MKDRDLHGVVVRPYVATLADDELASRRIETALERDDLDVDGHGWHVDKIDEADAPDALVVACGRGVTERDQLIRRLRRSLPDTCIVAVMPEDSRRGVRRAIEAGADGVVFDAAVETALSLTVRSALAGQTAVPAAARHEVDRPTLSGREKQVLAMVVMGLSNKVIASELYLAESTVKCHLSSAFSKLGVRSRNEAADLILHSGSHVELGLSAIPSIYASTEGSER